MKVLVLSQKDEEKKLIHQVINGNGNQLVNAVNKQAVYSLLKENPQMVIFADFDYPSLNGLDLVNHVLTLRNTLYPFIVFITEGHLQEEAVECLGPVPGDLLLRPINKVDVALRLKLSERTMAMQRRIQMDAQNIGAGKEMHDELTNVFNRQTIYQQALTELDRAQHEGFQVSVALVDVLNLEKIAHEYGPDVRNQVVQYIARVARANLRMYDLVGRWEENKFLLVLPGVNEETAGPIFNRIHLAMTTVRVSVSDAKRIPLEVRIGYTVSEMKKHVPLYMQIEQANQALKLESTGNLHSAAKMYMA